MSNVITIAFLDKKEFPPGKWLQEPDLCFWHHELPCLAIRDMSLGTWKGWVGLDEQHPFYGKRGEEIINLPYGPELFGVAYGGSIRAGTLFLKYRDIPVPKDYWWLGVITNHSHDLLPLVRHNTSDPEIAKMLSIQTYKDLHFIRRETNKLATYLYKIR